MIFYFTSIKLGPVYREAKRLSTTISDTCNLAEAVSSKVRELDVTRVILTILTSKLLSNKMLVGEVEEHALQDA